MGRRSEQRIVIAFPVVVRGSDSHGSPFVVTTETHDVSCTGASLKGLQGIAELGRKIEIECQNQKAWYRVQWSSASNRTGEWRIGVRCLEPGKYIWGVPPKEWEPDSFDPAAVNPQASPPGNAAVPPSAEGPPRERRRFARHACRLEAQVITEGAYGQVMVKGKITDISLSGCYIEMLSPLPDETPIELTFSTGTAPLHLAAKVCTAQDGFGMGVAFTGMSPEDFETLRVFAPPTKDPRKNAPAQAAYTAPHAVAPPQIPAGGPHRTPSRTQDLREAAPISTTASAPHFELYQSPSAAELGPLDLPDPAVAVEALLRLLLRKGVLTRAELLEELERLKAPHT
jgi:PilZ domain